ncbi:MAG: hypothetical protein PHQ27_03125 [Victivallales bacterium]|nr:hypothetical protein [Victivallales bacterium]
MTVPSQPEHGDTPSASAPEAGGGMPDAASAECHASEGPEAVPPGDRSSLSPEESLADMIDAGIREAAAGTVAGSCRMECIDCGAVYNSEQPLETCECPQCHGVMYPQGIFNEEDTVTYDAADTDTLLREHGSGENEMTESKRALKVAQPVSVGMFTSTHTGPISGSSSTALKMVDFLSGSSSSIQLEPRVISSTEEEMAAIDREKRNLLEERRRLQEEQNEFASAVAAFENRSKDLEELRLNLELEKENQVIVDENRTANLQLQREQLQSEYKRTMRRIIFWTCGGLVAEAMIILLLLLLLLLGKK